MSAGWMSAGGMTAGGMTAGGVRAAFRGQLGGFRIDAGFTAPGQGVTALYGPSGCGKTSVLRAVAGLQRFAEGACRVGDDVWQDATVFRPPHRRAVGYVFQEPSLFAHLTVRRNLLFGARHPTPSHAIRFDEVVALLRLETLLPRAPHHLSGGERQRVAIGRALLSQPRLLLMDEPLAALDAAAKDEILPFLERLRSTLRLPVIYVTHDMAEVERLADHLVLMDAGRVLASGALADLQSDPALPLAATRDAAVSLEGRVQAFDAAYGMLTIAVPGGTFLVPAPVAAAGDRRRLRIAARDVSLAAGPSPSTILNVLPARLLSAVPAGPFELVAVLGLGDGDGARLLARVTRQSWDRLGLTAGAAMHVQIKAIALS